MKNLLVIAPRYPHAHDSISGSFVHSQIEYLRARFDRVVVVSTTPRIPRLWSRWLSPRLKGDAWASNYSYDNVDVYFPRNIALPLESLQRFRVTAGYSSIRKILKASRFKPDLVHAHFLWPSGAIAARLKADLRIPYVVTAHGYDVYDLPFRTKYYSGLFTHVLDEAEAVIAVAEKLRTSLTNQYHLKENKVIAIPNGFDQKLFHPADQLVARAKLNLPLEGKFILSVGTSQYHKTPKGLIELKGHRVLSEAFYQLSLARSNVVCGIVGDVPEREIAPQARATGRFRLFGPCPHNQVSDWINACDVFALPSLNEGLPTVLMESLGCGKPVIATRVGGVPDIITSHRLGILVDPGDPSALATALMTALDTAWDPQYIHEHALQFTWERIADRIFDVYLGTE